MMPSKQNPSHPVASTSASDPAAVADLLPIARALASGGLEEAEAALLALPAARIDDPPVRLVRAMLAWRSDALAEAITVLRPAHEADPENGSYAEVLAALYALVGNLAESLFLGKLATGMGLDATLHDLIPSDFPTFGRAFLGIEERPLLRAARNAVNRDRPDRAIQLLRDHVDLFRDDHEAWRELLRLLLEQGQFAEADAASQGLTDLHDPATLSLLARTRCAAGAHALAAGGHDGARIVAELNTPEALPEVAAARICDLWWCAPEGAEITEAVDDWVHRYCPATDIPRRPANPDRITVGFLVAGEVRHDISAAAAQIARAFNRQTVHPLAYGHGVPSHPRNSGFRNAFAEWRDIRQIDPATLARIFRGDGLDVIVDLAGYGYPTGVLAVAQSDVPLRVLWSQLPIGSRALPYDVRLTTGAASDPADGALAFAVSDMPVPLAGRAPAGACAGHDETARLVVGCDILPAQANKEFLAILAAIAMAAPDAILAIRDNGFSHLELGRRLIAGLGVEAGSNVQLVNAASSLEFCRYLDLAIAPSLPSSAAPVVAALAAGCPVLTLQGSEQRDGSYAALLDACGLSELVAMEQIHLIRAAAGLLADRDRLVELQRQLRAVDLSRVASASRLADGLEHALRASLLQRAGVAMA